MRSFLIVIFMMILLGCSSQIEVNDLYKRENEIINNQLNSKLLDFQSTSKIIEWDIRKIEFFHKLMKELTPTISVKGKLVGYTRANEEQDNIIATFKEISIIFPSNKDYLVVKISNEYFVADADKKVIQQIKQSYK